MCSRLDALDSRGNPISLLRRFTAFETSHRPRGSLDTVRDGNPAVRPVVSSLTHQSGLPPANLFIYLSICTFILSTRNISICLSPVAKFVSNSPGGRAIAQAVSRRIPTAAARVQTRVWSCGILWWTRVALGQVFSENFGFPCANLHSICFSTIIFITTRGWAQ
jgi:hypothetical protein